MTVWQKISGLAGAVGDAGSSLLHDLAHVFGLEHETGKPQSDVAFTIGVIALSAKMAKADGVVSPLEVAAFRQVFQAPSAEMSHVARIFNLAKQDVAGYDFMPTRSRPCSRTTGSCCRTCSKA